MSLTSCSRHPVKLFLFFLPFLPPLVFEKAEIMPPFALALQCHEQACQFPSFSGCCLASRWNWTRVKTWHVTSPCPLISESDCVNQVGSNPSSQALHGMRVVVDGSLRPTTLVKARRDARCTDTSSGPVLLCLPRQHIY